MTSSRSAVPRFRRPLWTSVGIALLLLYHLLAVWGIGRLLFEPSAGFHFYGGPEASQLLPLTDSAARAVEGRGSVRFSSVNGVPFADGFLAGRLPVVPSGVDITPGAINRYQIANSSEVVKVTVEPVQLHRFLHVPGILFHFVSLVYLITGLVVWWRRPGDPGSLPLLIYCAVATINLAWMLPHGPITLVLASLKTALLPMFGTTLIGLVTGFSGATTPRTARAARVALVIASMLSAAFVAVSLVGNDSRFSTTLVSVTGIYLVGTLILVSIASWEGSRPHNPPAVRHRARFLGIACLVCFVVPSLGLVVPNIGGRLGLARAFVDLTFLGLFPVLLGYAIVRHRLFDLGIVLRQSVVYGALSLLVTLVYVGVVLFTLRFVGRSDESTWFVGVAALGLVVLASVAKLRVQRLVDRTVFKNRARYAQAVREASAQLAQARNLEVAAATVQSSLIEAMGLARGYLLVAQPDSDDVEVIALGSKPDAQTGKMHAPLVVQSKGEIAPLGRAFQTREVIKAYDSEATLAVTTQIVAPAEIDRGRSEVAFWSYFGVDQVIPLIIGERETGDVVGLLVLGPKTSGRPMDSEDEALVYTLANQLAVAIDNARAFAQVRALKEGLEDQVANRTRDLSQALDVLRETQGQLVESEKQAMLGRIVAGILHEVNSPLGALRSASQTMSVSTAHISSYLSEAAAPRPPRKVERAAQAARDLTGVVEESVARISEVVGSLKSFAALDEADEQVVDIRGGLSDAITLLEGRLPEGASLVRRFGDDHAKVRCYPARLNQLFFNLIENAINAVSSSEDIVVEVQSNETEVIVVVADSGCGISSERLPKLFDFDFATKKGARIGLRLGLPMSKRFVDELGGRISVTSVEGEGTRVEVSLPAVAASSQAALAQAEKASVARAGQ